MAKRVNFDKAEKVSKKLIRKCFSEIKPSWYLGVELKPNKRDGYTIYIRVLKGNGQRLIKEFDKTRFEGVRVRVREEISYPARPLIEGLDLEELLGNVCVDQPHERDRAPMETQANWPEGWWAVSDDYGGYIAYFAHEADAYAYRLMLINAVMNTHDVGKRYRDKHDEEDSHTT